MKMRLGILLLCIALAGQALGAHLAAPQGLTLSVQPGGVWRLVWDPILDDSLMGYTVLARPEGSAEFARLTKGPIPRALFQFRGLAAGQDEELVVVADYEKGHSALSQPVHTRLAVPAPADAGSQAALKPEKPGQKPEPLAAATPFFSAPVRPGRGLLIGRGQLDAKVNLGYDTERTMTDGWSTIWDPETGTGTMPFGVTDWYIYDPTKIYYWELTTSRTIISVPVTVRYGLMDALEVGATGAWHSESAIYERATVDGNDYDRTIAIPEMHTSGLADTTVFANLQPVASWPFKLSAEMVIPTGSSRFAAFATNWTQTQLGVTPTQEAGTGDGITRFTLRTQWGWKALKPGMFFEAAYSPSASEDFSLTVAGHEVNHHATYGEVWEGGFGYTMPWEVVQGQGALVLGVAGTSIKPGTWTVDGYAIYAPSDTFDAGLVHTFANLNLEPNNELELYAQVEQDITQYLGTSCKAYWRNESDGYSFGICGGVVY